MDIIFWDFLILYQIFFSQQVERSVIISNKHGIYELPHELPNHFILRKDQENLKTSYKYNLVPSLSLKFFPVLRYFTWKLEFVSNILTMIVDRLLVTAAKWCKWTLVILQILQI